MLREPVTGTKERRARPDRDNDPRPDWDEVTGDLVDSLEAIAYPNRFKLLTELKEPRAIGDIKLTATVDHGNPDRVITREGVRHHMKKLRDAGFVKARTARGRGQTEHEYVVDRTRLYELSEALRDLPLKQRAGTWDAWENLTWDTPVKGCPNLTVVHGSRIGESFPLRGGSREEERGWIIGRNEDVEINLDWDACVDDQAAEIHRGEEGFEVIDLRSAKRRVVVNGEALDRGERVGIGPGDVISVGRSVLVLQDPT